jgi:putative membrane-bound dehydrogenase-like protein
MQLCFRVAVAFVAAAGWFAAPLLAGDAPLSSDEETKAVPGFELTTFATQPEVYAPACMTVTPEGVVYVGIDAAGSLETESGWGKIVRCVDTDGDGQADHFTDFTELDHPRGLVWDGQTLYALHPPKLTAFQDTDGDGRADKQTTLATGLTTDKIEQRGADHTTNGMRMGIDGWLYIAVGDFGMVKAQGSDGSTIQIKGGGIARIRPDGSNLQVFSHGLRNPYDVAITPRLNLLTRGNTNDGGGWDVRLQHMMDFGHQGYPSLYMHFNDEIVPPLTEYGGGSGTGALYIDEPAMPKRLRDTLLTTDWGVNRVFYHQLKRDGISFEEQAQKTLLKLTRPTDADVDARGNLYIAGWGPTKFRPKTKHVGEILRLHSKSAGKRPVPDFAQAEATALVKHLTSPSGRIRFGAARELLRRDLPGTDIAALKGIARANGQSLAARIAAIFTLKQAQGGEANPFLLKLADAAPKVRAFALRALADDPEQTQDVPSKAFIDALDDEQPRVQREAIVGLGRLKRKDTAEALLAKLDGPRLVRHLAVKALVQIDNERALLSALDETEGKTFKGVLWALKLMHKPMVVEGLIDQLRKTERTERRRAILIALMRLYNKEGKFKGGWWGTRPNTHGPYYDPAAWSQTERIGGVLKAWLLNADEPTPFMSEQLERHQVELDLTVDQWLALSRKNEVGRSMAVRALDQRNELPEKAARFLLTVARDHNAEAALREQAFEVLLRHADGLLAKPVLDAAGSMLQSGQPIEARLQRKIRQYTNRRQLAGQLDRLEALTRSAVQSHRELVFAALVQLSDRRKLDDAKKQRIVKRLEEAWQSPKDRTALLRAIGHIEAGSFADRVTEQLRAAKGDPSPALVYAADRLDIDLEAQDSKTAQKPGDTTSIAQISYEAMVKRLKQANGQGDPELGKKVFRRTGCIGCHTVSDDQTPKGPELGDIAARYSRGELIESIAKPNASVAQGFATVRFKLKDGSARLGFVVEEGSDEVTLRNIAGVSQTLKKANIVERETLERSMMPPGLANMMTVHEFNSLLAYLDQLERQASK